MVMAHSMSSMMIQGRTGIIGGGEHMSGDMRFPTMWYVRPSKDSDQSAHMFSLIRAFASR